MIERTREMRAYEAACEKLEAAGIAYEEKPLDGYKVSFKLTKGGMSSTAVIDFGSENAEQHTDFAIEAFAKIVALSEAEKRG